MNMREQGDMKEWMEQSLATDESTAPLACLVVKSWECVLKALTLACT